MSLVEEYLKNFNWLNLPIILFSPGEKTAGFNVYSGECLFAGILVVTDGSNDAKVIVYDNTEASGTVKWETTVTGSDHYGGGLFPFPVHMENGIYVDVTGTGASYIPFYGKLSAD